MGERMNILDENVPESQRLLLERRRIAVKQIGLFRLMRAFCQCPLGISPCRVGKL